MYNLPLEASRMQGSQSDEFHAMLSTTISELMYDLSWVEIVEWGMFRTQYSF